MLAEAHRQISNLLREMPVVAAPEIDRLGLLSALQEAVAEAMNGVFGEVIWQVDEEAKRKL